MTQPPDPQSPDQPPQPPPGYGPPPPGYGAPPPAYGQPPGFGPMHPGAPFGVDPVTGMAYSDKSRVAAGLLQLFLGTFGAGRWYTGHTGIALAQLFTCGGLGIWALVDAIMMLVGKVTDAQGRPLHP